MLYRKIGIREAKAQLSRLIREAQQGYEWTITDHGRPVAKIIPIPEHQLPLHDRVKALEENGIIEAPAGDGIKLPTPLPLPENMAQKWLEEDRTR